MQKITPFVIKVKNMREAQKKYFSTRDNEDLKYAKLKEKEVDEELELIIKSEKQYNMLDMIEYYD